MGSSGNHDQKRPVKWSDTSPPGSCQTSGNSNRCGSIDMERWLPGDVPVKARKQLTFLTLENCKRMLYATGAIIFLIATLCYGIDRANHHRRLPGKNREKEYQKWVANQKELKKAQAFSESSRAHVSV